ncbi:MAG: SDR family oxidoreductase [Pseudomonadota bacterium]
MPGPAIVTGGARGLGRAMARDLAEDRDVAVVWRETPPEDLPAGALAIQADLAAPEAPQAVVDAALARFGRIEALVLNAATFAPSPLEDFDPAAAARMLEVNLIAQHALLAAAAPHLGAGAAVVAISSVNAVLPPRGGALFGASKAALELWVRGMAKELGPRGIRVNAVAPGAVEVEDAPRPQALVELFTQDTALGRLATPRDVARAVRFLLSEDASMITGETLTVSGGYRL